MVEVRGEGRCPSLVSFIRIVFGRHEADGRELGSWVVLVCVTSRRVLNNNVVLVSAGTERCELNPLFCWLSLTFFTKRNDP